MSTITKLTAEDLADIRDGLSKLSPEDRKFAEAQRLCPVLGKPLGIMGKPLKVDLGKGRSVWVCCKGCPDRAQKDAESTLKKVEEFKKLPPIETGGKP